MIELSGIGFTYPQRDLPALTDASLRVERGELIVVAGPSGGGKSTLLRCINGLVPHFHGGRFTGRAIVNGISTLDSRPRQLAEHVGFLGQTPEEHGVVDRVEDDIAFTLENLGFEQAAMRKRIEESLDALGIAALRARKLETLSGGERQKAAIASALAAMPSFLVLDEPASQLDPQSADEVISALLGLRDELGIGIVVAEHRLDRVLQYADELCLVDQGTTASGPPQELLLSSRLGPPVVQLSRGLGWSPIALSLKDARRRAAGLSLVHDRPAPSRMAAGDEILRASELDVTCGDSRILRRVSLTASEGDVIAIMGRNGSGKTTLLRALAGLVKTKRGEIRVQGDLCLVPQDPSRIIFGPTVGAEILTTLRGRRRDTSDASIRSEAVRGGIEHLLACDPLELSGGERTKVAIAAACAGDPTIVMLDEPTRGMDDAAKAGLRLRIHDWSSKGRAVLLATHDVELAAAVATRVVILADGEVVVDAPPREALSGSLTFSTQMNKVFSDPDILTLEDALGALGR